MAAATPSGPRLFYVKCRPQGADLLDLCLRRRRVFIGYPPVRADADFSATRVHQWLLDISDGAAWDRSVLSKETQRRGYKSKLTSNRRLVRELGPGSIVVIPRPGRGELHLGVVGPFELSNTPAWADEYLKLRASQRLSPVPAAQHVGDIVQGWPVPQGFTRVPFAAAPRWLTTQLLSRTTAGIVKDGPHQEPTAFCVAQGLLNGTYEHDWTPTLDPEKVLARLLRALGPASFEQLVCELLELEAQHDERWMHVGGSGDGGADGLAFAQSGDCRAGLTCKLRLRADPAALGNGLRTKLVSAWGAPMRVVVAWLAGPSVPSDGPLGVEFFDGLAVARRLVEHRRQCVFARMVGVDLDSRGKTEASSKPGV